MLRILFAAFLALVPASAFSFPEMVKHDYSNCTSCHLAPNGGGLLTQYGRELSREIVSTHGREHESDFLYGLIQQPEWLVLGGDVRVLRVRQDNLNGTAAPSRTILMQADLEAALNIAKFSAQGTIGRLDTAFVGPETSAWISRRHWLAFRPGDEFTLRAGRFMRTYGINIPEHTGYIKRGLGWDERSETYNLEAAYLGEKVNIFVTGNIGRPDDKSLKTEAGFVGSASLLIADHYKLGSSYYFGNSDFTERNIFGVWAILGFSKKVAMLAELDFQRNFARTFITPQWGLVDYVKFDYEPIQGIHGFVVQQLSRLNFLNQSTRASTYNFGVQWLPRPHFDLQLTLERRQTVAVSDNYVNWWYFQFHYYL